MKVIKKSKELQTLIEREKKKGKIIGLVPTMGYLHSGHISLIKRAKKDCGIVVVSIYVNPTQFGPGEDYQRYPRDLERDKKLAKEAGTDILFVPSDEEIYPDSFHTYIQVEELSGRLCGVSRPIHSEGLPQLWQNYLILLNRQKPILGGRMRSN